MACPSITRFTSHEADVIRLTFSPEQLIPVLADQTAKGLKAEELITKLKGSRFVTGGIYFRLDDNDRERYLPDGMVYVRSENGGLLSGPAPFKSGGYMLVDRDGSSKLIRSQDFAMISDGIAKYVCDESMASGYFAAQDPQNICSKDDTATSCSYIDRFQVIVQSNLILVANGQDDGNGNTERSYRSALTFNHDGTMSIFATDGEIGKKDFTSILIESGVLTALNLDGGPSVQIAERLPDGSIRNLIDWTDTQVPSYDKGKEDKTNAPNRMPLLFVVRP